MAPFNWKAKTKEFKALYELNGYTLPYPLLHNQEFILNTN